LSIFAGDSRHVPLEKVGSCALFLVQESAREVVTVGEPETAPIEPVNLTSLPATLLVVTPAKMCFTKIEFVTAMKEVVPMVD
jgi:hypothetical protein